MAFWSDLDRFIPELKISAVGVRWTVWSFHEIFANLQITFVGFSSRTKISLGVPFLCVILFVSERASRSFCVWQRRRCCAPGHFAGASCSLLLSLPLRLILLFLSQTKGWVLLLSRSRSQWRLFPVTNRCRTNLYAQILVC